MNIQNIIKDYDLNNITIAALGGHSALDTCEGAKKLGFKTLVVAKKGREKTYTKYYKTNGERGCVDEVMILDEFSDINKPEVQAELRKRNVIFVHSRYFWVYCDFKNHEKSFEVPIFGSREFLKLEERDVPNNQYWLLEKGGIRIPKIWKVPELVLDGSEIKFVKQPKEAFAGSLTLTKINNAVRTYERENFVASTWTEWLDIANEKLARGEITFEALKASVIEEFILGAQINFNFFYDPIKDELDLMGTDMRRQTNLDGILRLPAHEQLKIPNIDNHIKHIETGHVAITCKESLLEKAFEAGENFLQSCRENVGKEMIGPFALQGAIDTKNNKEEIVVFDVSMRIPGSPGIRATPYTEYKYGRKISYGERIAMQIKEALEDGKLEEVLS